MCLPYWNSELDIEAGGWAFSRRGELALPLAGLHSKTLKRLCAGALSLGSELLYLCGQSVGIAGWAHWKESTIERFNPSPLLPFTLIFGYSSKMERFSEAFAASHDAVRAGVSRCTFWNKKMYIATYKTIAYAAEHPLFDERAALESMASELAQWHGRDAAIPYYSERLGYLRAPVQLETDDPKHLQMLNCLDSIQFEATRAVVGPPPFVPLPGLYQLSMGEETHE